MGVERDAQGVPTLTGRTRQDLAWALGYLHAQERFFQMDGLRRAAAGELSDLVGAAAMRVDRRSRPHRFRSRAAAIVAGMEPAERRVLDAYVEGVNRGLTGLKAPPFEYLVLPPSPCLGPPRIRSSRSSPCISACRRPTAQRSGGGPMRRRFSARR